MHTRSSVDDSLGSWAWYLLLPAGILIGYEFATANIYGHGLLATAGEFSRNHRLWSHASKGARTLITLSYLGGGALPALVLAVFIWSRKEIAVVLLASGTAAVIVMRGSMRLGLTAGISQAFAARGQHWALITLELMLFLRAGFLLWR